MHNKNADEVEDDHDSDEDETSGHGSGLISIRFEENEKQKVKEAGSTGKKSGSGSGSGGRASSPPSCQAERCGADLGDAKIYHRRHKVCEFHSKAAVVMVSGARQRFCQQCSRFWIYHHPIIFMHFIVLNFFLVSLSICVIYQ